MRQQIFWLAVVILLAAAFLRINQLRTYPPGPHYDEAANILITRSIALDGANLFPIANSYQGRESLYFYINAPLLRLIGDDLFMMRLSSTFLNLLTIAASMGLARAMFPGRRGVIAGLVVGVAMTISFHQIFMSRQAYRAVTLPAMQALALLFLWRGLRAKRGWILLAIGGVFSAGALYTYMASRLFPLWLGLAALVLLWSDRRNWRKRISQGVVFLGAMGIASIPLAIYAIQNPDIFFQRLTEVSDGDVTVSLAESVRLHMEMFFIRGDFGNLRYNDPGRPYFTVIEAPLLIIGWMIALWRLFLGGDPVARAAYMLVLLSPLMVIPSVISVAGFPPSHMRSLGMVPMIFLTVGVGFEAIDSWLVQQNIRWRAAGIGVIFAGLLIGGVSVYQTYSDWVKRADLFYQADGDLAAAVDWLNETVNDDDMQIYVSSYHREHPTVIAGYEGAVTWLGLDSLILPPPGEDAMIIFSHQFPPPEAWGLHQVATLRDDVPLGPDGLPAFWAYEILGQQLVDSGLPRSVLMSFVDMQAVDTPSGSIADVTTRWAIQQTPPYYRLRPILTLRDDVGRALASNDVFMLGTNSWQPGEILLQQITLEVPPGTPPGDYPLTISWVDRDTDTFVSYVDNNGAHAGIEAEIGTLRVTRPETFPPPDVLPMTVRESYNVADGVRLLGWNLPPQDVRSGAWFDMTLFFQGVESGQRSNPLMLSVELLNSVGETTIWEDTVDYAPSQWVDGELVTTRLRWRIPYDHTAGQYELVLNGPDESIRLASINVQSVERLLEPVPVDVMVDANFNDEIRLHGYTLTITEAAIRLEMVWQALSAMEQDYTLFVHLLDENGLIIDQYDAMPGQNQHPTSLWQPGEYVIELVEFAVEPDRDLQLHVGFYRQKDGVRLRSQSTGVNVDFWEILTRN